MKQDQDKTNGERFEEFMGTIKSNENFKQYSIYEHKETVTSSDTPTYGKGELVHKDGTPMRSYRSAKIQELLDEISVEDKIRYEKLETLAKLLAASWFYGDWKWESPNERVQQMLMQELGYFPFKDEDEMIRHTRIDDNLYKQAAKEIPARKPDSMDFVCTTEDCPHCAEDIRLMEEDGEPFRVWECCGMEDCICEPEDDGLTTDEWVIKELKKERVEISDEEIEKAGWDYELNQIGDGYEHHFIAGAKWYREQLKKK